MGTVWSVVEDDDDDGVDALIAHGGWLLDDARARHAAHPETFWLPPADDLARIDRGAMVQLIFRLADMADPVVDKMAPYDEDGRPNLVVSHERMWVRVEEAGDAELLGVLDSMPLATHCRLVPGARIRFRREDVIDLDLDPPDTLEDVLAFWADIGLPVLAPDQVTAPEDRLRDPTTSEAQAEVCARYGVRPERPAQVPTVRALVGGSLAEGTWPVYGMRSRPQPDRGHCGWVVWAVHPDMADAAAADGLDPVPFTEVRERNEAVWPYLALPPGWAFVLDAEGSEDVYQDPTLLDDDA